MKRRIAMAIIALSLLLGFVLWGAEPGTPAAAAVQANYPLNPNNFTSLGASPFGTAGTYTIDASRNNTAPTLSGPGISTPIAGVFFTSSGGEIAVFTFDSINIPADVTVQGARTANSRPIALLSRAGITIAGTVDVGGDGINAGPGGGGGGGAGGGVGGGVGLPPTNGAPGGVGFANGQDGGNPSGGTPGRGGDGGAVAPNGNGKGGAPNSSGGSGAFGGAGVFGTLGGTAYGDLTTQLQGGSGGGGAGGVDYQSCSGRGGGGAIEIGATSTITISGAVNANGAGFCCGCQLGAGAGAGGGVIIHGVAISFACSGRASAQGGSRGSGSAPGGGGRVHLAANTINTALALSAVVNVSSGGSGNAGVFTKSVDPTIGLTATKLAFGQQPTSATPNTAINPAVTVRTLDACDNPVTTATNTIALTLNNVNGATLGGATSVAAVGGVATFNNLTLDKLGMGYTLTASGDGLTGATSNAFNITCQAITVNPTTSTLTSGTVGASYSQTFTQTGGSGATTFSKTAGTLPPGLTLTSAGVLGGTPNAAGAFTFTITATDANNCPGSREYSLTIACPTVTASVSGDTMICPGGSSTVTVNLSGGTAPWTVALSGGAPLTSSTATFNFTVNPAATTTYTASATNAHGCAATVSGNATVTVGDNVAPTLTLKSDLTLWPPNHSYHTVTMSQIALSVSDGCSTLSVNDVVIEKVTSDEPNNVKGGSDGETTNDIVIATNCRSALPRAERDERKNGRVYVITLRVRDGSGNTTRKDFKVSVPIGQSGAAALNTPAALTKTSSCPYAFQPSPLVASRNPFDAHSAKRMVVARHGRPLSRLNFLRA